MLSAYAGLKAVSYTHLDVYKRQTCYPCRHGRINVCTHKKFMGINEDGFFTEYYKCNQFNIVKLPQGVTHDMGMLVEPFAVGANAAERAGAEQGKNIVIVGAGTIGNCTAQIAVARGANVLITDIKDGRLQYAQDCGIKNCCNTNRVSLAQAIDGAFGSAGADGLIDCCGTVPYTHLDVYKGQHIP